MVQGTTLIVMIPDSLEQGIGPTHHVEAILSEANFRFAFGGFGANRLVRALGDQENALRNLDRRRKARGIASDFDLTQSVCMKPDGSFGVTVAPPVAGSAAGATGAAGGVAASLVSVESPHPARSGVKTENRAIARNIRIVFKPSSERSLLEVEGVKKPEVRTDGKKNSGKRIRAVTLPLAGGRDSPVGRFRIGSTSC